MANFSMRTLIKSTHESAHSNMRPSATVSTFQLLFLASLISILHHPTCADPPYNNCSSTSNFTSNSKFQSNLLQLLNLLNSQSSNSSFHYTYFGEDPDRVYGNFLCYSYVSRDNCKRSLLSAIQDIQMRCPTSKEAITWEEYCQLRYSDKSFFGLMDYTTNLTLFNYKNISDPDLFKVVVKQMLGDLSKQAAFDSSGKMYALGQSGFGKIDKVYGLVQCTEDLSGRDCYTCLQNAISAIQSCCYFYRGARVLARSCFLRYELYPLLESGTSSSSNSSRNSNRKKLLALIIVTIAAAIVLAALLCFCVYYHVKRRRAHRVEQAVSLNSLGVSIRDMYQPDVQGRDLIETTEFPLISYATLCSATNNFSSSNILGEGGFGPVYKGKLPDGREVAVKTLSCISEQGSEEFMNEVLLIMKLQHKNLVRLLGCCVEGDEKVLVYEYMPNGSLDVLLFDEQRRAELDWGKRFNIVIGIARGLLYLHQDSRLRIIHRDLKASNILLDNHINPKISDFGMARIFGGTLGEANTSRIVGTYGYMAPEYAMEGLYSIKSDVFSFGVLLLEMVTGKKNAGFHLSRRAPSLLVYAWELWTEGRGLELIDSLLSESYSTVEFLRCIRIGLLCVQEDAADRPTMSSVVIMLQSESRAFPPPKQPASSGGRVAVKLDQSQDFSINNLIASSASPR